jgi:hypothetical protein
LERFSLAINYFLMLRTKRGLRIKREMKHKSIIIDHVLNKDSTIYWLVPLGWNLNVILTIT